MTTPITKCGMNLLFHYKTSTIAPTKFMNEQAISRHTLLGSWLFIPAEISVN